MKKSTVIFLIVVCVFVALTPTIAHALPIASDGSGHDVGMSGFVKWWNSPDRWWN